MRLSLSTRRLLVGLFLNALGLHTIFADAPYNSSPPTVKMATAAVFQPVTIYKATGQGLAHFPSGSAQLDILVSGQHQKRFFARWNTGPDDPFSPGGTGIKRSDDAGRTWPVGPYEPQPPGSDVPLAWIRLRNGTLFGARFLTLMLPYGSATGLTQETISYISSDNGVTWTQTVGVLTAPQLMREVNPGSARGGFVFCGIPWQANDGTIYQSCYGYYDADYNAPGGASNWRVLWVKTTNSGATWSVVSSIGVPSGGGGVNETWVEQCRDGSLYAVMRGYDFGGRVLWTSRSTDQGLTWSARTQLSIGGVSPINGVLPQMNLLPNGTMVLSAGRPDNWVAISTNSGTTWTNKTITYPAPGLTDSTGYTMNHQIDGHRVMHFYDTSWAGLPVPDPNPNGVYAKDIAVTNNLGLVQRIDLKTKFAQGLISISTNMNYANPSTPYTRPQAAFDGSSEYWASAFMDGTPGTPYFIIYLDKTYKISDLGIMLKRGYSQSAKIYFSSNGGSSWGTAKKTYTTATHYAVDYTPFADFDANAVKVELTFPTNGWAGLNEIELYTTHDTFENDSDGNVPAYYTDVAGVGAYVSATLPFQSKRSLELLDNATTSNPYITKTSTTSSAKTIIFQVCPWTIPNGFCFSVKGTMSSGGTLPFHLGVFAGGTLNYFNGSAWVQLAGSGTVPVATWSQIKIVSSLTSAAIYVNGVLKGTAGINGPGTVTNLNGIAFAGYGTPQTGDRIFFDDVDVP